MYKNKFPNFESQTPNQFICIISNSIMVDPVIAADGESYEREEITRWMKKSNISPKTGQEFEHKFLIPNNNLKRLISEYLQNSRKELKSENKELRKDLHNQDDILRDIIADRMARDAINQLFTQTNREKFGAFKYSRRGFSIDQKLKLVKIIKETLLEQTNEWKLEDLKNKEDELCRKITLTLAWKLHPERNWILRDDEDKHYGNTFFEPWGVLGRNGAGDNDYQIITKSINDRIRLAIFNLGKHPNDSDIDDNVLEKYNDIEEFEESDNNDMAEKSRLVLKKDS